MKKTSKIEKMVDQLWDENIHRVELYLDKVLKLQRAERRLKGDLTSMTAKVRQLDPMMAVALSDEGICCSFCGKSQFKVKRMVSANGVFICNECIELCNEIINDDTLVDE